MLKDHGSYHVYCQVSVEDVAKTNSELGLKSRDVKQTFSCLEPSGLGSANWARTFQWSRWTASCASSVLSFAPYWILTELLFTPASFIRSTSTSSRRLLPPRKENFRFNLARTPGLILRSLVVDVKFHKAPLSYQLLDCRTSFLVPLVTTGRSPPRLIPERLAIFGIPIFCLLWTVCHNYLVLRQAVT